MAVNFLHHLFQIKIECSAVSSDGYSPQNLVSESWRERNCGFLAAHFIKPPVSLLVQFPFPINVHSLVIKPKVGSQVSSGIDVFVAGIKHDCLDEIAVKKDRKKSCQNTSSVHTSLNSSNSINRPKTKRRKVESGFTQTGGEARELLSQGGEEKSKDFDDFAHKYSTFITPGSFKNEHRDIFTLVGRVNESLERTIRIINKRYGGKINPAIDSSGDASIHEFFQSHTLNYVTHVVIVVSRVKGSCVPALGGLEIWGQASYCCGVSIVKYVSDVQNKMLQKDIETSAPQVTKNRSNDGRNGDRDTKNPRCIEDEKIPSEFIDPITCTLMTIPMLLPSGLNIDLSTLEKHVEVERSWGRLPSDPFTGVLFSDEVKPLPNGSLKVRIDKYILTSGADVQSRGRTVGRSCESVFPKTSLKRGIISEKEVGITLKGKLNCELLEDETREECTENKKNGDVLGQLVHHDGHKEDCMDGVSRDTDTDLVQSHEEKVSESLRTALMKTLGGASFTRRDNNHKESVIRTKTSLPCTSSLVKNVGQQAKPGTSTNKVNHHHQSNFTHSDCIGCNSSLSALSMFQLPCKHLLCRGCLTDQSRASKTLQCSSCGCGFEKKDVIRVHH